MKSKKWLAFLGIAAAVFAIAVGLVISGGGTPRVAADSPHAGLNLHIAVDTNGSGPDDCDTLDSTGSVPTKCSISLNGTFTVKIYLDTLGGITYAGYDSLVTFSASNLTYKNNADANPWPDCVFEAVAPPAPGSQGLGCSEGTSGDQMSTYTGLIGTMGFTCSGVNSFGSVTLVNGPGATELTDHNSIKYSEGNGTSESLVITCGTPPTATRTPTSTPTVTRTPTITNTPTSTATPTITRTPTNTPTATPLPSNLPDVTVTKTDSPDPVSAGGTITYSVLVKNLGQQAATGVVMTDFLPAEVAFQSASGAPCTHSGEPLGGTVTCNIPGSIAQNGQVKIVILVTAPSPPDDIRITNLAAVAAANEPFFNQGNNQDFEQTVALGPRPDLVLTKVDVVDPVVSANQIVYNLTVDNIGPEPGTDVVIKDNLPDNAVYDDANSSAECDAGGGGADPDVIQLDVVCNLGTVAGSSTVHIAVTAPTVTRDSIVVNLAYVTGSNEPFSSTGNNFDGEYTAVLAPDPDIAVNKTGPAHVKRTEYFPYTITIQNIGLGDAFNVHVTDTLPMTSINSVNQPMTLVNVTGGGASCSPVVAQVFTCTIPEIDANGGQVVLTVNVRAPTVLTNTNLNNTAVGSVPNEPGEPLGNDTSILATQIRACFDVNGDNFVRIHDILAEVDHYFASPPSPSYDLLYDFDGNNIVAVQDILLSVQHYFDDAPCVK